MWRVRLPPPWVNSDRAVIERFTRLDLPARSMILRQAPIRDARVVSPHDLADLQAGDNNFFFVLAVQGQRDGGFSA